ILLNQMLTYLNQNSLLAPQQFGFRKSCSTASAINSFVENIIESFEQREFYGRVALDLSKAFDCVPHNILLRKLYLYNFHPSSVRLVMSYLQDRQQQVSIGSALSDATKITHGVPQGSILGPVLFSLYVNDLPSHLPESDVTLYADDTGIGFTGSSVQSIINKKSNYLTKADEWFLSNKLSLNNNKTISIVFTLRKSDFEFAGVDSFKYLGVYIDSDLSWKQHGDHVATRVSKNCFLLRNLSNALSTKYLKLAFVTLIQCHLDYAILAWGHYTDFSNYKGELFV